MGESGSLTRAELYDRLRSQIEHEDELINIRVVWQLLAQSFFFSTYATLLNATGEPKNLLFGQQQEFLLWAVPIAALLAGLLASISIFTSIYTIEHLGQVYRSYTGQLDEEDQSTRLFPAIQGPDAVRRWARIPPIGLPVLFILTWVVILIRLIVGAL
ncbi:MAG: hypothetical protein K0S45_2173 [Nitrospira sp.]|nr:hypothetical protein [Nitrospira sp.]